MRLPVESYADFAAQLHVGQDTEAEAQLSVTEELRRLQIDPEVFYRGAPRLGVRRFSPDDVDPSASSADTTLSTAAMAQSIEFAAAANACVDDGIEGASAGVTERSKGFAPPNRWAPFPGAEPEKLPADFEQADEATSLQRHQRLGLNVPQGDGVEEIALDAETHGGRMGHETPRGISAHIQIDSLTDDGDDEDFRAAIVKEGAAADEGDEVETFSLDPDFDYDTVTNLSRRV